MHCSRRRLLWRGLEFHVCTINESAHTKNVRNLLVFTSYFLIPLLASFSDIFLFAGHNALQFLSSPCYSSSSWSESLGNFVFPASCTKPRWELHKYASCCFGWIMEEAPHKMVFVRPLTSSLTKHLTRHVGHCWGSRDKPISEILQWVSMHRLTSVSQPVETYIHQFCADNGCRQENM